MKLNLMRNEIIKKATFCVNRATFGIRRRSPEILLVAGVVGGIASVVMACVATTRLAPVVEEAREQIEHTHECEEVGEVEREQAVKDLAWTYTHAAVEVSKLYAPAVVIGILSVGCIFASHGVLRRRNVALAAAYELVDKGYKSYRAKVAERFGSDVDREIAYDMATRDSVEYEADPESGKERKVHKAVPVSGDPNRYSPYARFFDELCPDWNRDPELNMTFLRAQQNYANEMLQAQGYLFLNDVYDMLQLPRTKAGQTVGWKAGVSGSENGDGYVDFGIYRGSRAARDFVNGYEPSILLDFNVDGPIMDVFDYEI